MAAALPAWRSPDLPIRVGISSCLLGWSATRRRRACRASRAAPITPCGMERVKVYGDDGPPARTGTGLFARVLTEALPLLPVEEEGRLNDAGRRDNFITRVFAYRRLAALRESGPRPGDAVGFHAAHEYLLLAHRPVAHARLGRLVAEIGGRPLERWLDRYRDGFMRALCVPATPKKHVDVLRHVTGLFEDRLSAGEKRELREVIRDYARELVPLVVPITLVNHYVARFEVACARDQVYLHPHPKELMLRNHV